MYSNTYMCVYINTLTIENSVNAYCTLSQGLSCAARLTGPTHAVGEGNSGVPYNVRVNRVSGCSLGLWFSWGVHSVILVSQSCQHKSSHTSVSVLFLTLVQETSVHLRRSVVIGSLNYVLVF